jgi:hypothetical protein
MTGLYPVDIERRQQRWHRHLRKQPCVYCGSPGGHPDHVPPKGIFYGEVHDLITVPCCERCTNDASALDTHFKVVVAARVSSKGHQSREELVVGAARGAARDGKLSRHIARTLTRTSTGGIAELPTHALQSVGNRIVRGLFWHEYGDRFPANRPVSVWQIPSVLAISPTLADAMTKREVGQGQFRYAFLRTIDDPWFSVWALQFHGTTTLIAETNANRQRDLLLETTVLSS